MGDDETKIVGELPTGVRSANIDELRTAAIYEPTAQLQWSVNGVLQQAWRNLNPTSAADAYEWRDVPHDKALTSLAEHNAAQTESWQSMNSNKPRRNGLACPQCGEPLLDTNPNMRMLTAPPMFHVHCSQCEHTGARVA